jgi:uncharacterized protein YggE
MRFEISVYTKISGSERIMRDMKSWILLSIGLAGLGSVASGQVVPNVSPNCNCPERRTISAPGTAQVVADADLAVVRVGYKLFGSDAKASYDNATEVSNAIMNALISSGIPKSAIESTSQALQHTQIYDLQQFPMGSSDRDRRQFTVSQSWIVRVKPDEAAKALSTAISAGANEGGWIQWIVEDPSTFQAKASSEATARARDAAEQIAERLGVHLGRLMSVMQNQGSPYFSGGTVMGVGSIYGMGDSVMMNGGMQAQNQQFAINSRRIEFRATVNAVFEIEDGKATTK